VRRSKEPSPVPVSNPQGEYGSLSETTDAPKLMPRLSLPATMLIF